LISGCGQKNSSSKKLDSPNVELPFHEIRPLKSKTETLGFDYDDPESIDRIEKILQTNSTVGIWKIDINYYKQLSDSNRPIVAIIWPDIFKFDGTYLTAHYLCLWSWTPPPWASKDSYYKMATKWVGDTLKYLTPHNNWEEIGVYEDSAFSTIYPLTDTLGNVSNYTLYFRKIQPSQVADYEKPILKYRKVFNYDRVR
jgi:hypothetical protein